MRLLFPFSATRFATQMSEMHLGSTEYEKWKLHFNFLLPKCQTGKWVKNTATCFLNYLVTLVVRNMKARPICCFLLLGGHMKNGWTNSIYTDLESAISFNFWHSSFNFWSLLKTVLSVLHLTFHYLYSKLIFDLILFKFSFSDS